MKGKLLGLEGISLIESLELENPKIESISIKDIAVIGIDCSIGGTEGKNEYWEALVEGKDCIKEIPESRKSDIKAFLESQKIYDSQLEFQKNAYIDDIDMFDFSFFSISPKEASLMDPNQRLFLQTVWRAIEDAGYSGKRIKSTHTGVFLGDVNTPVWDYKTQLYLYNSSNFGLATAGNIKSIVASRISYLLDLKGPALMVDTACSSSLVAIHTACHALRNGVCDMAIAGGVNVRLMPIKEKEGQGIGIKSSDSRARTFDDSSDGTGGGEGSAAVILKPLRHALNDGDNIYAVIKGSAINQDGRSIGITAPSSLSQEEVIASAWKDAGIEPSEISYIEAHGTGTKLGDPIEIEGMSRAFRRFTNKKQFCAVGAVKTNIGHLDSAAGISGFIKTVLALKNKCIPQTLHFNRPNRKIDFEDSPLYINDRLQKWENDGTIKKCGVSSFGLSGTNCHIVLEEAPCVSRTKAEIQRKQVFVLSAKTLKSLKSIIKQYQKYFTYTTDLSIEDICYTASTGREHYNYRIAIMVQSVKELVDKLCKIDIDIDCDEIQVNSQERNMYYGYHNIVSSTKNNLETGEITADKKSQLNSLAVDKLIETSKVNSEGYQELMQDICKLYVEGAEVEWETIYQQQRPRKISLPVYEFDKKRCWYINNKPNASKKEFFHKIKWKRKDIQEDLISSINGKRFLVLRAKNDKTDSICSALKEQGASVVEAIYGEAFNKIDENIYAFSDSLEDYEKLTGIMNEQEINQVIHLLTIDEQEQIKSTNDIDKVNSRGVESILNLAKAFGRLKEKININITIVSQNVTSVTSSDSRVYPYNACLFGISKVVGLEYPNIKCRCIDVDEFLSPADIIDEISGLQSNFITAYRNSVRYVEVIDKIEINSISNTKSIVKTGGTYIITGGTGGIGLEIARYLASLEKVNLILINRTALPEKHKWNGILEDNSEAKLCKIIRSLKQIEDMGSKLECYAGDVSDIATMTDIVRRVKGAYGCINGVIHSAGMAGRGFIFEKSIQELRGVLLSKVHGAWVLDRVTQYEPLDFFVMFSSVTSIKGAPGQGDYTAANSFLDSFTYCRKGINGKTITINWPSWKEVGMAVDNNSIGKHQIVKAISTNNGLFCFDEIMKGYNGSVIVGEINYMEVADKIDLLDIELSESIMKDLEQKAKKVSDTARNDKKVQHNNVEIKGIDNGSYSSVQKTLAYIWSEVLGLNEISIYNNFNELGGDSILATHLLREIEKEFPGQVDITDIYSYPTIFEMSNCIETRMGTKSNDDMGLDSLLDKLAENKLSIDEVAVMMEKVGEEEWKH